MDNPNLAGGPIEGSDIAIYKVSTSYKLGGVQTYPYGLSKDNIKAIDRFTYLMDITGKTSQFLSNLYPESEESEKKFFAEAFRMKSTTEFGKNWASNYYKHLYKGNIWPACFPKNDEEFPRNNRNGLVAGWLDRPPTLSTNGGSYLNDRKRVYFEQLYEGNSRLRNDLKRNITKLLTFLIFFKYVIC